MSKKLILIALTPFLFAGCHKKRAEEEKIARIDLVDSYKTVRKVNLSEIAQSIEYIPLGGDSSIIIDEIRSPEENIKFSDNMILVRDTSDEVFLFDASGNFLNKIGNKGRGPGEYTNLENIALLHDKNLVVLYDIYPKKVMFFTEKGALVKDLPVDLWSLGLVSNGTDLIFVNTLGTRQYSDFYGLTVMDTNGKILKRLLNKPEEEKLSENENFRLAGFKGNGYWLDGDFHYFENSTYSKSKIWKINDNYELQGKYEINIGEEGKMPLRMQTEGKILDLARLIKYNTIESLVESSNHIFARIYYAKDKRLNHVFYDKSKKSAVSVRFDKINRKGINFAFYNDLDGGLPFWPTGKISDNKFYMLTYGYRLKEYMEGRSPASELIGDKYKERFLALTENTEIKDNPILMVVTLKN